MNAFLNQTWPPDHDRPILKTTCKEDPILKSLPVIRQPNGTNYKISPEQWQRVFELLQG
jgi:hypothetical protein